MRNRTPTKARVLDFTPVPRRCNRHDGWTPARQKAFIEALADTGSVSHAAAAVNMAAVGAYQLRRAPGSEEFAAAWDAALDHGVRILFDAVMERAIHGVEIPVYSYGKLIGARRVYNDRLAQFILANRLTDMFAGNASRTGLDRRALAEARAEWEQEQERKAEEAGARVRAQLDLVRERLLSWPEEGDDALLRALHDAGEASEADRADGADESGKP